jgi:hypothetical protein
MKLPKLITLIACFISFTATAQNIAQLEANLLKSFKKIAYWADQTNNEHSYDSFSMANSNFENLLKNYTAKYPALLKSPLLSLKKANMDIATSNDGLFRIYSWDTEEGGTMHFFANVMQYVSAPGKVQSVVIKAPEGDSLPYYSNIYTLKSEKGTYYLGIYNAIYSGKDAGTGVQVFAIQNGKLNQDVKLLKTGTGLKNIISYSYNFFSVVDIPFDKRPTITFDAATKTMKLPLVDTNGKVTKRFINYKFTGQYLERVK